MTSRTPIFAVFAVLVAPLGCDEIHYHYELPPAPGPSESESILEGAPEVDTPQKTHRISTFDVGNRFWFAVSADQVERMNQGIGGGPIVEKGFGGPYTPGGKKAITFAEHLFVTAQGRRGATADYGKVQVRLIGQSSQSPWTERTIPNIKLDADEFVKGSRVGGYEHLRFNNGAVGTIFREKIALDLYRQLGYPAPQTTFAWVGSNVWGSDVLVPYTLVQVYKRNFCDEWQDAFGGGCVNMWEFAGDFGGQLFDDPNSCQFKTCTSERVQELEATVVATPPGPGFKAALETWVDWDAYHRFQCLSWILATPDDLIHGQNNVVLVERADGRFQYLPYSVDISLGLWSDSQMPLTGSNLLSLGCQADTACWADTLTSCESLIEELRAVDPVALTDEVHALLDQQKMLRPGDEGSYRQLRAWFEARLQSLPEELEAFRDLSQCPEPFIRCAGTCVLPEQCFEDR